MNKIKKEKLCEWYDFFESLEKFQHNLVHFLILAIMTVIVIMNTKIGGHILNYDKITEYYSYKNFTNYIVKILDGKNINYNAIPPEYDIDIKYKVFSQKKKITFCHYSYNGRILKNQLVVVVDKNNKILKINEKFTSAKKYKIKMILKLITKFILSFIIFFSVILVVDELIICICKYVIYKALSIEKEDI